MFKPFSVRKFIEFGLFGDTIFDDTGNLTFTDENASNDLKSIFHIFFYILAHLGMPNLKVGILFKFRNVSYLLGHPVHQNNINRHADGEVPPPPPPSLK